MVVLMGVYQLMRAPAAQRANLLLGETALRCPLAILLLAVPVFMALLIALGRQARTRLHVAGGAAGLLGRLRRSVRLRPHLPGTVARPYGDLVRRRDSGRHPARRRGRSATSEVVTTGSRGGRAHGAAAYGGPLT